MAGHATPGPYSPVLALPQPRTISPTVSLIRSPPMGTVHARAAAVAPKKATRKPKAAAATRRSVTKFTWRKRDAQDSRYYNLQLDINDLKMEIKALTQARQLLFARQVNTPPLKPARFVATVLEFLRVFRHGFDLAPVPVEPFLRQIMAADVWVNEFPGGIELVVAQWKVYSACFAEIDLQCTDSIGLPVSDPSGRDGFVVRARAKYFARITQSTIDIMFPHLARFPLVAAKLRGRRMCGHSRYDFVFDGASGHILRCDVAVEFVSAFAKLLPDPRDLYVVFNGAKLESDFYVGDGDDKPADALMVERKPFKDVPPTGGDEDGSRYSTREVESPVSVASKMDLHHILS